MAKGLIAKILVAIAVIIGVAYFAVMIGNVILLIVNYPLAKQYAWTFETYGVPLFFATALFSVPVMLFNYS